MDAQNRMLAQSREPWKTCKNLWFLIGFSILPDVTKNVASMISELKPVEKLKKKRVQNCVPKMCEKYVRNCYKTE